MFVGDPSAIKLKLSCFPVAHCYITNARMSYEYKVLLSCTSESNRRSNALPKDCSEVLAGGGTANGVYTVQPLDNGAPIDVYCDMETSGGGWTVR